MSSKDNMDPRIEELLPFYALDALTEEEKGLVEAYLAKHPDARAHVQEMQADASALPYAVAPIEPPSHVKQSLMARVQADVQAREPSSSRIVSEPARRGWRFDDLFRVLSLGAAAVAVIWAFVLNTQVARLKDQISSLNEQMATQSQSIDKLINGLPQTNPSNVITVALKGTDAQPRAQGQLIADPTETSAVLVISGLPPLEAGKTYQVWLIGDAPVSAGLLTVDQNGQSVLIVTSEESIGSFKSLGISVEPDGGSEQPTGEIVLLSEL